MNDEPGKPPTLEYARPEAKRARGRAAGWLVGLVFAALSVPFWLFGVKVLGSAAALHTHMPDGGVSLVVLGTVFLAIAAVSTVVAARSIRQALR